MKQALIVVGSLLIASAIGHPRDAFTRLESRSPELGLVADSILHSPRIAVPANLQEHATPSFSSPYQGSPYLSSNTKQFVVNSTGIPDIPFDIGESYAGLLPISDVWNETRKLYFWFFPSGNVNATDEIAIWFNGGPGCSSLTGLIHENGPFLWQTGTQGFTPNTYAWRNLTNIVYVEQPVGVGFTQGTPDISNEVELGQQFIGFWKNFVNTFRLENRKVYITGESYSGYYIPYVADAFINAKDKVHYNLQGISINDPILGDNTVQQDGVGGLDYILPVNGTLLSLQNVTWNGKQGFESYPGDKELFVPYHKETNQGSLSASGIVGKWGSERGLTFYHVCHSNGINDCGTTLQTDEGIRQRLKTFAGLYSQEIEKMKFGEIRNLERSVKEDMQILENSPYLTKD
ncbi:hypothetical protein B7463_g5546, partial [Scytalidium lignicola]